MLAISQVRERPLAGWEHPRSAAPVRAGIACESFRASASGRLVASIGNASLRVVGRESDEVRVQALGPAPFARDLLDLTPEGDDLYLCASAPRGWPWRRVWPWNALALEVSVPPHYAVDVESRQGPVRIEGVRGPVEARSQSGGLLFRDVAGCIEARSARGAIAVERCSGELELRSERGSIRIEGTGRSAIPA